jgi:hypothetical protein
MKVNAMNEGAQTNISIIAKNLIDLKYFGGIIASNIVEIYNSKYFVYLKVTE